MAVSVSDIILATQRELNEAASSSLAEVGDGAGGIEVPSDTVMHKYITMAQNDWCMTAWPIIGYGTINWPASALTRSWQSFATPSGQGRLFCARSVGAGEPYEVLDLIGLAELSTSVRGYEFAAAGTPIYYYEEPSLVGLYPPPLSETPVKVFGLCLPVPAGDGTGGTVASLSFAPDDVIERVIPRRTAIFLAEKWYDDPSVFGRLSHLVADYELMRQSYRAGLSEELRKNLRMPEPPRGR